VLALDIVTKDFVSDTQLFNGVTSNLCVRTSIGYGGDAGSFMTLEEQKVAAGFQEVNFIETLVTINYNFDSTITGSGVNVVPVEKGATTVKKKSFQLTNWLCDPSNGNSAASCSFNQGSLVLVCNSPEADAVGQGVSMSTLTTNQRRRNH